MVDRMFEHLSKEFRQEDLFRDIDSIPKGRDFRLWIDLSVAQCDVLIAVIGPRWLEFIDETGKHRLDNPTDFVRVEIESALRRDIPVIPVLLAKTNMPKAESLPVPLRDLAYRNGTVLRLDPDFANDMRRLIEDVEEAYSAHPR